MHGLNIAQQIAFLISHHFLFLPEFHFIRSHTGLCLHQKLHPHLGRIIEAIGSIFCSTGTQESVTFIIPNDIDFASTRIEKLPTTLIVGSFYVPIKKQIHIHICILPQETFAGTLHTRPYLGKIPIHLFTGLGRRLHHVFKNVCIKHSYIL